MNTIQGKFFELTRSIFFFLAAAAFCSAARAETVLYVPGAGHLSVASGIIWQTDIRLFNPGSEAISVALAFLPPGLDNTNARETTVSVSPSRSLVLADVVSSTFSTSGLGAVRLTSAAQFLATSETYAVNNPVPVLPGVSGFHSTSLVIPAVDASMLSPRAMVFTSNSYGQIESGPAFRLTYSNLGLVNPGTDYIEVAVALIDEDTGIAAGSKTLSLPPGGFLQTGDIFSAFGIAASPLANAIITVSATQAPLPCACPSVNCCPSAPAPILAYLTVRGFGPASTTFSLGQAY